MQPPLQQTLLNIRSMYRLRLEAIAEVANVNIEDIYYLEAGVSYPLAFVTQVLGALSQLTGNTYIRENVRVYIVEEETHA